MKETGIERIVDDLGRIAIPKNIRDKLGILEDTKMELCLDDDGNIILRKLDASRKSNIEVEMKMKVRSNFFGKYTDENAHTLMYMLEQDLKDAGWDCDIEIIE